jgi:hypothetical protein
MVEVIVNTPSDGTRSVAVAELEEHAAFHAARNARVSLPEALPDAPNALTSNTADELFLAAAAAGGVIGFDMAGGSAGGFADTVGDAGGFAGKSRGGWADDAVGGLDLAGGCAGGLAGESRGGRAGDGIGGLALAGLQGVGLTCQGDSDGALAGAGDGGFAKENVGGFAGGNDGGGLAR